MGLFDFLAGIVESAKADAIADSKKQKPGCVSPNSLKEQAYRAYKNGSDELRDSVDKNTSLNYRERYESEKKK